MDSTPIQGTVDAQHRLVAKVPASVPPGPVTIWLQHELDEDEAGRLWTRGIAQAWSEDLNDVAQDIYSPADGDAIDEAS